MKLKYNFVIREVAGVNVAVSTGDNNNSFNGVIKLNDTAKLLFECLMSGASVSDMKNVLIKEYAIDIKTAERSVYVFLDELQKNGIIEE